MPTLLYRLTRVLRTRLTGWPLPLAVVSIVFATSWLAMWLVEPAGSELVRADSYWWYFVVTAATVGYGDLFPMTTGGRIVGAYVIVGGIVTLTILFSKLATYLSTEKGRRMKGVLGLDLDGHVVLLGYTPGRTERIVLELAAEGRTQIALCAWDDVRENPMPEDAHVHFVRGDLTRDDVMERACVPRARTVIVDVRDDNEALAVAVAVDHASSDVHLVVALRDLARRDQLGYVNPGAQCVQWHMPYLLSEEALDPGLAQVYNDLMSTAGHGNTYSMRVPAGFRHSTFGDCQTEFGRRFGATLLAMRDAAGLVVNPAWDSPVADGSVLYYVAGERVDVSQLAIGAR